MKEQLKKAAELLEKAKSIQVITHLDADGISAGAIASQALRRTGKEFEIRTVPGIHEGNAGDLSSADLTMFTDLGSGQLDILHKHFKNDNVIILDHHQPYGQTWNSLVHVNPVLDGVDGGMEISGAGVAYHFAVEVSSKNKDLSKLAVVGAVGDVQNLWGKFEGMNIQILKEAVNTGTVHAEKDIMVFGRHTRPVFKTLQYFTDPFVPGVSNDETGAIGMLQTLNIPFKQGGDAWRTIVDLDKEEKQRIADQMIQRAMTHIPPELASYVPTLVIGDVYTMLKENIGTELRGALEFSTCLNATGRNDRPEVGLNVAEGDRDSSLAEMMSLLREHRKNIAQSMRVVEETGTETGPKGYVQYFNAGSEVSPKIVGTIAGMILGSENTDPYKPMVGMALGIAGVKVSARCSRILVLKGIDMASAMRSAARGVGGVGGGHKVACGGTIPEGKEKEFIEKFEKEMIKEEQK